MALPPTSRRPVIFVAVALAVTLLLYVTHRQYNSDSAYVPWQRGPDGDETPEIGTEVQNLSAHVQRRINHLRTECQGRDPFEEQYGRTNLRMTRGYEGASVCGSDRWRGFVMLTAAQAHSRGSSASSTK